MTTDLAINFFRSSLDERLEDLKNDESIIVYDDLKSYYTWPWTSKSVEPIFSMSDNLKQG